jgi:hypothetical protein
MHEARLSRLFWYCKNPMRDPDIRSELRSQLFAAYGDNPSTLILDELGICSGSARVDMAVVNGELKGFEIKSDRDSLTRLPNQSHLYGKVFDTISAVIGPRHLQKVESRAPSWWGIIVANPGADGRLQLEKVRDNKINTEQDPYSLVQLLWRDEVLELLARNGLAKGLRNRPRRYLWQTLAMNVCLSDLRAMVREQLKLRTNWRVAGAHMQGGVRSPLSAKS